MDLLIFWNHIGREHGGLEYARDIRKNRESVIERYRDEKERYARNTKKPNRFIRYNASTLVELPPLESNRKFLIIYLIKEGLQFSLNFKSKHPWWLIDVVDIRELKPDVFCVYDLFIDISVRPDGSYQVLDIDEFEEAVRLGILSGNQVAHSLKAFHSALTQLNEGNFPNGLLKELEEKYM
ncbi:DUF402 domain-containing protein [Planomicrobium sp. CPCC 101079]|uniref:DUF402 domain-containing protein n=1 Tax=Planomicrobium sp. CPCC 101079 TaxID=2599618 RepID=UPI0011B78456|nr:DUF402 domain-containing protein [Planomicrobium sp. CPCC 101079]TWT13330.1 hypothetical protein FQV28_02560 [Planomicrobium sp. CPCC 101079]